MNLAGLNKWEFKFEKVSSNDTRILKNTRLDH